MGFGGIADGRSGRSAVWRINLAIIFVAAAVILVIRLGVEPAVAGDGQGCRAAGQAETKNVEEPTALIVRNGYLSSFGWIFDARSTDDRDRTMLDWELPAQRPDSVEIGDELEVTFQTDLKSADGATISDEQVSASAVVTGNGVLLSVCVDISGASPDRYTSTVAFVDRDIKSSPLPIEVIVKHRAEWVPLSAMVAGLAVALILLFLSLSDEEDLKPAKTLGFALAALIVAIATARPWEAWQNNPTWGKGRLDAVTLIAATALAFTGAMVASTTIPGLKKAADEAGASGARSEQGDTPVPGADVAVSPEVQEDS